MSVISLDPQITGAVDDGTESGSIRTIPLSSRLVPKSIRAGGSPNDWIRYEAGGGATVALTIRCIKNPDYLGAVTIVTCPAADFSYVKFKLSVYGRRFGVRWYYTAAGGAYSGQPTEPFVVTVDGRAYEVAFALQDSISLANVTSPEPFLQWIVPDLLDDGRHEIEIHFLGDRPGGTSRAWILNAVLLDGDAGYQPQRPLWPIFGPWTALNTWDSFAPAAPFDPSNVRVMRAWFHNVSGSAASISAAIGAGNDANIFWSSGSIAAGESKVLDIGEAYWAPIYLKASASASIRVHVQANVL